MRYVLLKHHRQPQPAVLRLKHLQVRTAAADSEQGGEHGRQARGKPARSLRHVTRTAAREATSLQIPRVREKRVAPGTAGLQGRE